MTTILKVATSTTLSCKPSLMRWASVIWSWVRVLLPKSFKLSTIIMWTSIIIIILKMVHNRTAMVRILWSREFKIWTSSSCKIISFRNYPNSNSLLALSNTTPSRILQAKPTARITTDLNKSRGEFKLSNLQKISTLMKKTIKLLLWIRCKRCRVSSIHNLANQTRQGVSATMRGPSTTSTFIRFIMWTPRGASNRIHHQLGVNNSHKIHNIQIFEGKFQVLINSL